MPLEFGRTEVALVGSCGAEEALELSDWLAKRKRPKVNLAGCSHVHAALLQTILAYHPAISAEPADAFLARWLRPIFTAAPVAA